MRNIYILLLIVAFGLKLNAQTVVSSTSVPSYNIANEGDLYIDENNDCYIGQQNGTLKTLGNVKNIVSSDGSVTISKINNVFDLKIATSGGDDDSTNEIQTISKTGITTTLSNGGGTVDETITSMEQSTSTGVITYYDEELNSSDVNVVSTDSNNTISVGSDGGAYKAFRIIDTYDSVGNQSITTVFSKLSINKERINIGSFSFSFDGDIKVPEQGIYEINYSVAFSNTTGGFSFSDVQSELRLNGTKIGGSDIFIAQTTDPVSSQSGSRTVILNLLPGDILNIWSAKQSGSGTIISEASGSGLTIKKLS